MPAPFLERQPADPHAEPCPRCDGHGYTAITWIQHSFACRDERKIVCTDCQGSGLLFPEDALTVKVAMLLERTINALSAYRDYGEINRAEPGLAGFTGFTRTDCLQSAHRSLSAAMEALGVPVPE